MHPKLEAEMPSKLEAKFYAFTLAGSEFCKLIEDLWEAASASDDEKLAVAVDRLSKHFSEHIELFFRTCQYHERDKAAGTMVDVLRNLRQVAAGVDPLAAASVDKWLQRMTSGAGSWDYNEEIWKFHDAGRLLATKYFREVRALSDRLGAVWKPALGCRQKTQEHASFSLDPIHKRIKVEFSFELRPDEPYYVWYVALPFRFLHEYTAHIFPFDVGYQLINDGWMMEAAQHFLNNHWEDCRKNGEECEFSRDQAGVFNTWISYTFAGGSEDGVAMARDFRNLLRWLYPDQNSIWLDRLFDQVTFELCCLPASTEIERMGRAVTFVQKLRSKLRHPSGFVEIKTALDRSAAQFVAEFSTPPALIDPKAVSCDYFFT